MAKKVLTTIKLQAPGGQASPAPPVGPALGQHGINIMEFVKAFNAQTADDMGVTIPVEITVFEDRSFTFITKTPPAAVLIRQAINIEKGSSEPHTATRSGRSRRTSSARSPTKKLQDLNAHDVDQAAKIIAGTARSMGVEVVKLMAKHGRKFTEARAEDRPRARVRAPPRRVKLVKDLKPSKFDESVELHIRTGPERPPRRRAAARHRRAAARARQGGHDRRLRQGRQGARGRGGRRRHRGRRGPRRAACRRASPTSTSPSRRRT